ncbi:MAG: DUF7473 family protein [Halobacteriota archaeon]
MVTPSPVVLQSGASPIAVAGTIGLFAVFLSITAHIAARNVLGDVPIRNAFGVGPLPAIVAVGSQAVSVPTVVAIVVAIAVDFGAIQYLYGQRRSITAYITGIHVVVTVLVGTIGFGILTLVMTAPT